MCVHVGLCERDFSLICYIYIRFASVSALVCTCWNVIPVGLKIHVRQSDGACTCVYMLGFVNVNSI